MQNLKIINMLLQDKISYNKELDTIYINGIKANTYDIRVICAKIKERAGEEITEEELKNTLIKIEEENLYETQDINIENTELNDIIQIINDDDTIDNNDWSSYIDWKDNEAIWKLDKDGEKTSLIDCFANIVGFIEHFPKTKDRIRFNNIRNLVEYNGVQVTDNDYHSIINMINKYFLSTFSKIKMVKDAVDNVANKNRYNPWVEYFDSLEYKDDGTDYIEYIIKEVLCCEEIDKYYDLYYESFKITFLACMDRIYKKEQNKKVKFDSILTLAGVNGGSGKTTFAEKLFDLSQSGDSYCYIVAGDTFQPKDKDFLERSHQCTCLLLDELTMRRSIVTSIKGYITQQDDRFRKSYGYNSEAHIRGFIIMANSNNDDILKDYTTDNERRWLIVHVSEDTENYQKVNKAFDEGLRDKLWAFIKNIYVNEEYKLYMTDERLIKLEEKIQRNYKASNNADYNTIIEDLLEREYGFVSVNGNVIIDTDFIVEQYKYNNSYEWCKIHNEEVESKLKLVNEGKYTLTPRDRKITHYGKIDRISKKQLYDILNSLKFDYTKTSFNAEMRYSGVWNGWKRGNNICKILGVNVNAYWRIKPEQILDIRSIENGQQLLM